MYAYRVDATLNIAANASVSDAFKLDRNWLISLVMPAAWTAASLTFQGSNEQDTPTTWADLYSETGEIVVTSAAASRGIILPPTLVHGWWWVRLRSGTSAAPVAQLAARQIIVRMRQFA